MQKATSETHPFGTASLTPTFPTHSVRVLQSILTLVSKLVDREIVLRAVSQHWRALHWASKRFRGDKEIVLIAVCQDWQAFEWASNALKEDREVVLKAVSHQRSLAWQWASGDGGNGLESPP